MAPWSGFPLSRFATVGGVSDCGVVSLVTRVLVLGLVRVLLFPLVKVGVVAVLYFRDLSTVD